MLITRPFREMWNCDTCFLSRGRGGKETRKGDLGEEKGKEENGVVFNLNSLSFRPC